MNHHGDAARRVGTLIVGAGQAGSQLATKQRALEDGLWHLAKVKAELLLRPIGNTIYMMPPYILSDDEITMLATRTLAVFEQVIGN